MSDTHSTQPRRGAAAAAGDMLASWRQVRPLGKAQHDIT